MAKKRIKSPKPLYLAGAVYAAWCCFGPMYRLGHFLAAAAVSISAYCLGRRVFWKDAVITIPDPIPEPKTEEEKALVELKKQRDMAVGEMRRLNDAIADETISAQIDHLEEVTGKIFDVVAEKPEKRPQIRRFLDYYLPTTLKILNAYDRMDSAGIDGVNIDGAKGKIEGMMAKITEAFDKQLDGLFGAEALDISTDIAVMEQLLAREGIGGEQMTAN